MYENPNYRDPFAAWHNSELPDGSLCTKCLELHGFHAPCTPLKPLPADAVSLPPRSIKSGITGALSLHDYRKYLSQSAECVGDPVDRSEKTLKRKTATSNLIRPAPLTITSLSSCAISVSSAASSTPPLSPSYSHSIISYQSEQEPEVSEASTGTNTFREKLQRDAQARDQAQRQSPPSRPQASTPMLATTQAVATISHGGASFEILNPRKSLDVARIVSFIEDVDDCSILSFDPRHDSIVSSNPYSVDESFDRDSLSQFTDASLPSHYSSPSLCTTSPSMGCSTPKRQTADIPSSSPGVHDRVRSLSDYSLRKHNYWTPARQQDITSSPTEMHKMQQDRITDLPSQRTVSTTSRSPQDPDSEPDLLPSDPQSPTSAPTFLSEESDIGEPGSPVYANGEWAQVDERDRGIFLNIQPIQPHSTMAILAGYSEPPSPYDTYYANTMSTPLPSTPSYTQHYDPYDPVYFDPHVQSVLAAANADTMGLRGNSGRALDDLQRRFSSSVSLGLGGAGSGSGSGAGDGFGLVHKVDRERKGSFSQRKKLRKFFSWRSGH
ncbi:hypothetical protein PENSUB_3201 [Penicillium subrubescens]|uniref:Uncharacterized protein n=1 Tax=Penicillium subrubescens TaxID=1316194 RepID=A0A1Q5UFD5_9EURO|nr:hypothetical protein PENSUB_3201 [Penicillium subrubescens]